MVAFMVTLGSVPRAAWARFLCTGSRYFAYGAYAAANAFTARVSAIDG